jgi:hypothetical protein
LVGKGAVFTSKVAAGDRSADWHSEGRTRAPHVALVKTVKHIHLLRPIGRFLLIAHRSAAGMFTLLCMMRVLARELVLGPQDRTAAHDP